MYHGLSNTIQYKLRNNLRLKCCMNNKDWCSNEHIKRHLFSNAKLAKQRNHTVKHTTSFNIENKKL